MRIPIPERFRLKHVLVFVILVAVAQQLEHTDVTFTFLVALYTVLFALAFNAGSGFTLLSGTFIFFNGTQTTLLGMLYKIFLGEPGERNLVSPNLTLSVYCVGMISLGLAAFFSRRVIPKTGMLAAMSVSDAMKKAAIGCLFCGVTLQVFVGNKVEGASLSSALAQLNHFNQMAIILGTTYQIQSSKGKSNLNWVIIAAGIWSFLSGVLSFSKEGMFTPFVAWLLASAVLRYNFSKKKVAFLAVVGFLMLYYLVPYSQYGRSFRTETGEANYVSSFELLTHPNVTRELYLSEEEGQIEHGGPHFYDQPQGFMDREQMLAIDDALITFTAQGGVRGLEPLFQAFENTLPHFLYKDKPFLYTGNEYAREIGALSDEDTTTGISFSPVADAFHEATWFGASVVFTLLLFLFFTIGDSLAGDIRKSPWGLLLVAISAHVAAEGLLGGIVYAMTYGSFAVVLIALLSRYVLPIVSNLFTGGDRMQVRPTVSGANVAQGTRINPLLRQPDPDVPAS